ncbi:MAG: lef-5 protein [Cotesia congregata filamentous virus 2]
MAPSATTPKTAAITNNVSVESNTKNSMELNFFHDLCSFYFDNDPNKCVLFFSKFIKYIFERLAIDQAQNVYTLKDTPNPESYNGYIGNYQHDIIKNFSNIQELMSIFLKDSNEGGGLKIVHELNILTETKLTGSFLNDTEELLVLQDIDDMEKRKKSLKCETKKTINSENQNTTTPTNSTLSQMLNIYLNDDIFNDDNSSSIKNTYKINDHMLEQKVIEASTAYNAANTNTNNTNINISDVSEEEIASSSTTTTSSSITTKQKQEHQPQLSFDSEPHEEMTRNTKKRKLNETIITKSTKRQKISSSEDIINVDDDNKLDTFLPPSALNTSTTEVRKKRKYQRKEKKDLKSSDNSSIEKKNNKKSNIEDILEEKEEKRNSTNNNNIVKRHRPKKLPKNQHPQQEENINNGELQKQDKIDLNNINDILTCLNSSDTNTVVDKKLLKLIVKKIMNQTCTDVECDHKWNIERTKQSRNGDEIENIVWVCELCKSVKSNT